MHGDPVNEPVESDVENETVPEGLYPDDNITVQVVDDPALNDGHDTVMEAAAAKDISPKSMKTNKIICRKILFFLIILPRFLDIINTGK